jgi:hypothetical protein
MDKTNDNFIEELNQLRDRQMEVLDEIDAIRGRHEGETLGEIDKIQSGALLVILDIDEIRKRVQNDLQTLGSSMTTLSGTKPRWTEIEDFRIG